MRYLGRPSLLSPTPIRNGTILGKNDHVASMAALIPK